MNNAESDFLFSVTCPGEERQTPAVFLYTAPFLYLFSGRVIFAYDVLLDKLHSETNSYCSVILVADDSVNST